jgi:hypothetical protein
MDINVDIANLKEADSNLDRVLGQADFEAIMQRVAYTALESMRQSMQGHNRSSLTVESLETWLLESTPEIISIAVGTRTRGNVLHWLDKGRGEVRPKNRQSLRWFTFPEHVAVFAKYARATKGIELMAKAGATAINEVPVITQRTIEGSDY